MMGTGPFAAPTFRELCGTDHAMVALVTKPLRPGRSRRPVPIGPMREIARERGTPIFDPDDVNSAESRDRLTDFEADLLIVCDYGQILSADTLATTRLGGINIHGSLLPTYRGAAPVNWAIWHGETETGVSVIHMTPKLDAGPVIAIGRTAIEPEETAEQLEGRLSEIGASVVLEVLDAFKSDDVEALPQDASLASKAPRLKKTDGLINWDRPAATIKNQVRALQPWPKAYTFWHRPDGPPLRVIVGPVTVTDGPQTEAPPGTVVDVSGDAVAVAGAEGVISLTSLQPSGKRMLTVAEFLRGYHVQVGETFGAE
ncbi:MAG: methionyl-tRNA formyltransferase [Pirellulaceae bacterium]|nr:methionyl-tRNA formyltransferase [Pirellulaceae bacterium]